MRLVEVEVPALSPEVQVEVEQHPEETEQHLVVERTVQHPAEIRVNLADVILVVLIEAALLVEILEEVLFQEQQAVPVQVVEQLKLRQLSMMLSLNQSKFVLVLQAISDSKILHFLCAFYRHNEFF